MNTIVLVVRVLFLSALLAVVAAFAGLATGTAAPAAENASQSIIDNVIVPFGNIIQDANWRWEVVEERRQTGDTNLVDRTITELLVHEANVRGTIEYEIFFQVCNLADNLHYLSQDLYVHQFMLMGWFGF